MRDLDRALADILAIRSQIAAGTAFRGYGPAAIAATGGLALITAVAQFLWLDDPTGQAVIFSPVGPPPRSSRRPLSGWRCARVRVAIIAASPMRWCTRR
jgi:hypothetical protein